MAVTSFLAGALPLSLSLSQSQLRLVSSIGIGILVGTSLVVIIPEGVEAVVGTTTRRQRGLVSVSGADGQQPLPGSDDGGIDNEGATSRIGLSLILGFVLMFLVDRLSHHAADRRRTNHHSNHNNSNDNTTTDNSINLDTTDDSLSDGANGAAAGERDGFLGSLGSLGSSPRRARGLATTIGLVIHAAADGIALGASASSADSSLGFVVFAALMIHKAPAAFGLTSVLLAQGLSKRAARGHLAVFSLASPVGALATWLLVQAAFDGGVGSSSSSVEGDVGEWWTGLLLLFSAGTFLYVAMHTMQVHTQHSDGHHHANDYSIEGAGSGGGHGPRIGDTLATVGGMLLPLLTRISHSH